MARLLKPLQPPSPAPRRRERARRATPPKSAAPRILIVRRRYLGDTVLTQPFVHNLRSHWPAARITLVADTPYVEALADAPELDEVVELPMGPMGLGRRLRRWTALLRTVALRSYDIAFDFPANELAQLLVLLSRARMRVTLDRPDHHPHRRWVYTDVVRVTREEAADLHMVDVNNRLLEPLGVPVPFRVPVLPVSETGRAAAKSVLDEHLDTGASGGPLLVIHPGSGAEARRWPPGHFARVADHAVQAHGARVVVLGGPADLDVAREVAHAMTLQPTILMTPLSVRRLVALLAEADLLLCNDTGPMHLAAAVGTPVCALYGSESRVTWGPLGPAGHRTFQPRLPCGSDCVAPGQCVPGDPTRSHCIRRIPVEDVIGGVDDQLAGADAPPPPGR